MRSVELLRRPHVTHLLLASVVGRMPAEVAAPVIGLAQQLWAVGARGSDRSALAE
jgi:hypothetical protein